MDTNVYVNFRWWTEANAAALLQQGLICVKSLNQVTEISTRVFGIDIPTTVIVMD
jgi:hypothetical protein